MSKRNLFVLLTICLVPVIMAMNPEEVRFEIAGLKRRVKNNPKGVIPLRLSDQGTPVQFIIPATGHVSFKWGTCIADETSIYNACLAEELAPFVFDGRDLHELDLVTSRYPGVERDEIYQHIQAIRASRRPLGTYAESFQRFMDRHRNQVIAENRQAMVFRIKLVGVALVVVGLVYGIYRAFFAKKAVNGKSEDDESENELLDEKNSTTDTDAKPLDA